MIMKNFYHFFANGDDARNFIISEQDFIYEFNLIGICSHVTGVTVLSFSIEDSHPHALLYGEHEDCLRFKKIFEDSSLRHIARTRGSTDGVVLNCELDRIDTEDYLRNVAAYTIIQATKDGKRVMHYDYFWGTGSMYFRPENHKTIWETGEVKHFSELTYDARRAITSTHTIPDDWLICNGIILPDNYIDVKMFEKIFGTHNCYRTFTGAGKKQYSQVQDRMASIRGIFLDDMEARHICSDISKSLFGTKDIRRLSPDRRLTLAREVYRSAKLCIRQLSTIIRIPETELTKYLK